ncbi:hypothetical protein GGH94_004562 [Coemansia aciculifera]|uniref:2-amino-3-ketobutyrate coenzyme A ligase, mitochondrial n=1 Tax=Coemansia aciculifera TaxID=417176 RepID=A0A9W8IF43_9FUNG|nr:hypothetical protein GGH94_004562 [Coemansia aciculifera]KAJ2881102.1 hypothetical protein H4R27_004307 [Coemansia aciculifera]
MKAAGTFKTERIITTPQRSSINVQNSATPVLNFCANNYLGLADHPSVVSRATSYLQQWGNGLSSVRFICGTQSIHKDLEAQISQFYGTNGDTILYASCFDANAGIFESLLTEKDAIISDSLNHASIIDGVRLSKAQRFRYANGDVADLNEKLENAKHCRVKLVATDGVFSMDGNIAPLRNICDVVERHNAVLFVDDAHATGFLGPTGRGSGEYAGVLDRVHLVNSTLGKALGGAAGGYTTGSPLLISMLRNTSRPYLFSNTLPPSVVGAAAAALDIVSNEETRTPLLDSLWTNAKIFRQRMQDAGFTLAGKDHAIIPVMLGDARLAAKMAEMMLERGIYVVGFSYPVVPKDKARIRVQLSAAHTLDQVNYAVDSFIAVGRELKVI